jgi:hypothetical protein
MPIKVSNPKISAEFFQELKDEPAYANEKAFSATHAFLSKVVYFCRNQEYANLPATLIKELFDNYGIKYKPCLDALVRRGIIKIDKQYIVGAKTRGYKLMEKGIGLMSVGELAYLRSLFTDPKAKRKIQKQASYHRTKANKYKDEFIQYVHDGLMQYQFTVDAINYIQQSNWSNLTKLAAMISLTDFMERNFTDLKWNDADSRVWNEFVGMKSDLRRFFALGNLKYRYVMDIRSCHPLFLAHYLVNRARPKGYQRYHPTMPGPHQRTIVQNDRLKERSVSLSSTNTTYTNTTSTATPSLPISSNPSTTSTTSTTNNPIPHYVGGNSDIMAELNRWNTLFSDPDTDPKTVLIRELGYSRETAKAALNQTINGSMQYKRFVRWFKENFPLLYEVWARTLSATVGNEISAFYETTLMQDLELYRLAESLGLHLTYEYDGCGVMCREDDREAVAKIQQLVRHVQERSERLWGIRPIIVVKTAAGEPVAIPDRKPNRAKDAAKPIHEANRTTPASTGRTPSRTVPTVRKRRGSPG